MCNELAVAALKIKGGLQQLSLQSVAAFKATAVTTKFKQLFYSNFKAFNKLTIR